MIIFSILLSVSLFLNHIHSYSPGLQVIKPSVTKPVFSKNIPTAIYIPSIRTALPIKVSQIKNNEWLLTDEKTAFFGDSSALPGTPGTTVIFSHAKQGMFAMLPLLKPGAVVVVQADNTYYTYQIENSKIVSETDVSFLIDRGENTLILLTCFGSHDEKRIIFFGKLLQKSVMQKIDKNLYYI